MVYSKPCPLVMSTTAFNNIFFMNRSTGAVVLVNGREVAPRVVHSIVQTMAKTMDAVLFRQQLQVRKFIGLVYNVSFRRYIFLYHTVTSENGKIN